MYCVALMLCITLYILFSTKAISAAKTTPHLNLTHKGKVRILLSAKDIE